MAITEQLEKLEQLHVRGTLSDSEFQTAKQKLLDEQQSFSVTSADGTIFGIEEKTYCALMHLSQLLYLSGVGIVIPIVMWILGNEKSVLVHRNGHRMMNWIISLLIYGVVSGLLVFVFVGIPLLFILAVVSFVFPIIATVKATQGEAWSYPLTIKFFTED